MRILLTALLASTIMFGCWHKGPEISVIERTTTTGKVSVEIPAKATFNRNELPPSVDPKDIAAVVTITTEGKGIILESEPTTTGQNAKPAQKKTGKLFILKNGRTIAEKSIAPAIDDVQRIKPSYAWAYWTAGIIIALVAVAWTIGRFTTLISALTKLFGR